MVSMDPCAFRSDALTHDRWAAMPRDGIWEALSTSSHPSRLMSGKVRDSIYALLAGDRPKLGHDHGTNDGLSHAEIPCNYSPGAFASVPIDAAPGDHDYHHVMSRESEHSDRCLFPGIINQGRSAPIEVVRPPQWRRSTSVTERKGRNSHPKEERFDENLPLEIDREEDEESEVEAQIEEENRPCSEDERLPPHEVVAREWAETTSGGGSAFSLCEGVGRTLKGRDLCRVRNAILKQTGFI
ncbi:hypothetical protein KP509_37G070400 [Ceratopteris richardii]|uniref:Uncharacterized protein n=1 Tax=Ceratopteris richardii TaxID=49495 RepID=A0A8T2Q9S9_CERRI|nr:hypothetical protein KP509_37G070400 [Ceratopteris richardii]